ncbi:D-alanyl-lipoteichoic acid biosynthesis protein DltB [Desulfosporosinus sp. PR]|uniref:D-alanyl-lipoteichoic acid biosynthesis protein DltB n=1 Tax=Candidatus Desulfosporosinus nitrosoreducens TaxID=3401928 RepID=UPI0027F9DE63|nr:D-alanyl-lipoteichoic acid biosynthesis protein DltB [Desulfosporosinus sp. PR]MDQ7096449.1 D-alanyl-lipoteichoic acid biosynthesis protein DltB [Desulfosporosinus sp. PR]
MIPYANFRFFLWLLLPVIPAIILGFAQASPRTRSLWIMHSSLGMVYLILNTQVFLAHALLYFIWEYLIIRFYLCYRLSEKKRNSSWIFYLVLAASLLPLIIVKLSPSLGPHLAPAEFFSSRRIPQISQTLGQTSSAQSPMTSSENSFLSFLGISYVSFRILGTLIEIRDGLIQEIQLGNFISYVLFFPTLASGPIDRYRRFLSDLQKTLTRQEYLTNFTEGLEYIFRGFLYKFIIAYLLNQYGLIHLNPAHSLWQTIQYMYAYSAYLFFDFAGYSAFAIGVSRFFGIQTPENFQAPFWSKNIKDFWNRWHISLSTWFRDYIYLRFVLNSAKKKRFASRYTASAIGYLLLFLIMGIWHGTEWHFILYGLYMALLMISFEFLERLNKQKHFWGQGKAWDILARLLTLQFTCFGLLIFSGKLL